MVYLPTFTIKNQANTIHGSYGFVYVCMNLHGFNFPEGGTSKFSRNMAECIEQQKTKDFLVTKAGRSVLYSRVEMRRNLDEFIIHTNNKNIKRQNIKPHAVELLQHSPHANKSGSKKHIQIII